MEPADLYIQLGQLVAEMPQFDGTGPITSDVNKWLGRAAYLVEQAGGGADASILNLSANSLTGLARDLSAQSIKAAVYRALARAEAKAPVSSRGSFVAAGAALDALQVIGGILAQAKVDILVIDAYLGGKAFTDFAPQAPAGVPVRLLGDRERRKPAELAVFADRWAQQFGAARPLEVRLSARKALHDRLVVVDRTSVWSLTQSLEDFAGRSPALAQAIDPAIAPLKIDHYEDVWASATL